MGIDFTKTAAASQASGFKNYKAVPFTANIAGQTLAAGTFVSASATTTLDNTNSVSQVQTQYSGIEAFWRVIPGQREVSFPTYDPATRQYSIGSLIYFSGSTLTVFTYVVNQTAGNVTIPAITINCRAFLFLAPF